ncbi:MAG: hypothetical protein ACM3X6_05370 [Patescibacteria group bacterium]
MFKFEGWREGDLLCVRMSGFVPSDQVEILKKRMLDLLATMNGRPFKVFCDLRGLKAVSPRVLKELKEIDDYLYESTATKVGSVFDSIIAQVQHLRTANDSRNGEMFRTGRSKIFTNPDKCREWLMEERTIADAGE